MYCAFGSLSAYVCCPHLILSFNRSLTLLRLIIACSPRTVCTHRYQMLRHSYAPTPWPSGKLAVMEWTCTIVLRSGYGLSSNICLCTLDTCHLLLHRSASELPCHIGTLDRSRTYTERSLNPLSLPIGLREHICRAPRPRLFLVLRNDSGGLSRFLERVLTCFPSRLAERVGLEPTNNRVKVCCLNRLATAH